MTECLCEDRMSVDDIYQRSSVERVSRQGPSVSSEHTLLQSLQINGTKGSVENFSSEEILKTVEAIRNEDSSNDDSDPLNVHSDNPDVAMDRVVTSRKYSSPSPRQSLYLVSNQINVQKEAEPSITVPSENNLLDQENLSETELCVHFNNSWSKFTPGKDVDRKFTHYSVVNKFPEFLNERSNSLGNARLSTQSSDLKLSGSISPVINQSDEDNSLLSQVSSSMIDSEKAYRTLDQMGIGSVLKGKESVKKHPEETQESSGVENVQEVGSHDNSLNLSSDESNLSQYRSSDPAVSGWKLDRRESGHLYWRRDSSSLNGIDPKSRVKFRFDVEVCEFESRNSGAEDLAEEDDYEYYDDDTVTSESDDEIQTKDANVSCIEKSEQTSSGAATVIGAMAIVSAVIAVLYLWISTLSAIDNERLS